MKYLLLPLAALAVVAAACSTHTGDSYSTVSFGEANFIIDNDDPDAVASVSTSYYYTKMNWSSSTVEMSTADLVVDGKLASFDTSSMPLYIRSVQDPYSEYYAQQGLFSSVENVGKGASVTDLSAVYTSGVYNVSMSIPGYSSTDNMGLRLILDYTLDNRFRIKTFWPDCYYVGTTGVYGDSPAFSTTSTYYRVLLDFSKNIADVIICYPAYAEVEKNIPSAIVLKDLSLVVSHDTYSIVAESPKTQILVTEAGKSQLKDSEEYQVTDFKLSLISDDMTESHISYSIGGKEVVFEGCSIVKQKN